MIDTTRELDRLWKIEKKAKDLIKAIYDNSIEVIEGEDYEIKINQRFIADELEELRELLK